MIIYNATDLADTTPGEDLWRYSYGVSGVAFFADQGFNVSFDRNLCTKLESPPPPVNADWDPLTIQPDLALDSDGFYDAQATRDNPSLANPFTLKFVWLGTGTPAAQPFTIYNADFSTREQGVTAPEPSAVALLGAGLGMLSTLGARRR